MVPQSALATVSKIEEVEKEIKRLWEQRENCSIAIGRNLLTIRSERLYKDQGYGDFKVYCVERWGMDASQATRLIGYAQNAALILNYNSQVAEEERLALPANEAQNRSLSAVASADRVVVWKKVIQQGQLITGRVILDAAIEHLQKNPPTTRDKRIAPAAEKAPEVCGLSPTTNDDPVDNFTDVELVEDKELEETLSGEWTVFLNAENRTCRVVPASSAVPEKGETSWQMRAFSATSAAFWAGYNKGADDEADAMAAIVAADAKKAKSGVGEDGEG